MIAAEPARRARAVVAGPGARRALVDGSWGTVEHLFGAAGYVGLGERLVLLAPVRSPLGPLSLLVTGLWRGAMSVQDRARVDDGSLVVGSVRISLDGVREPPPMRPSPLAPGWRPALAAALGVAPGPPSMLAEGLELLAAGDLDAALEQLAGRGDGLTPAGDDVLAGFAAWRWADGAPVTLRGERCAPLGRAYLRCAERGELPDPAARVLEAIRVGDTDAAGRRAAGLRAWGATSGAALLWGMAAAAAARPSASGSRPTPA